MSLVNFVSDGLAVDYTPATDVAAGAVVVQGELIGVAARPIPANTTGSLAIDGVFDFPKAKGAGTAIAVGAILFWNATTQQAATSSAGNKGIGKVVRAATDDDEKVRARLSQ